MLTKCLFVLSVMGLTLFGEISARLVGGNDRIPKRIHSDLDDDDDDSEHSYQTAGRADHWSDQNLASDYGDDSFYPQSRIQVQTAKRHGAYRRPHHFVAPEPDPHGTVERDQSGRVTHQKSRAHPARKSQVDEDSLAALIIFSIMELMLVGAVEFARYKNLNAPLSDLHSNKTKNRKVDFTLPDEATRAHHSTSSHPNEKHNSMTPIIRKALRSLKSENEALLYKNLKHIFQLLQKSFESDLPSGSETFRNPSSSRHQVMSNDGSSMFASRPTGRQSNMVTGTPSVLPVLPSNMLPPMHPSYSQYSSAMYNRFESPSYDQPSDSEMGPVDE